MPVSAGTRLGPYEVFAPVGAGGMGEVYRARDSRLGREVALKILLAAFASDPDRSAGSSKKGARRRRSITPTSWSSTIPAPRAACSPALDYATRLRTGEIGGHASQRACDSPMETDPRQGGRHGLAHAKNDTSFIG